MIQKKDSSGTKKIDSVEIVEATDTDAAEKFVNIVMANYDSTTFPDGMIEILMDDQLYNGATLEITYTISVDNKSEYDTLRWIVNGDRKVAVIYYENEDYTKLPFYEQGKIIYHNDSEKKYEKTTGVVQPDGEASIVRTSANNIVDFVEPNLQFSTTNYLHEEINKDWELTTKDDFISSRETKDDIMIRYNQFIRAKDSSVLLEKLKPRDPAKSEEENLKDCYRETTLTLTATLATTASATNDYEYHNLIELTQMGNTSGRVKKIEYYDTNGKATSKDTYKESERLDTFLPTLGTSKSETVVIHAPTGLQISERVQANLSLVFVSLIILAGGIVLIKKFVLKPKVE